MNRIMKKFIKEFKEFISKGNVLDMAVGVIIGGAFSKIVSSVVNDLMMPIIGIIIGGHDFSNLVLKVGNAEIRYGSLIQNIVDFIIVAFCIFIFIKTINKFHKKKEEPKEEIKPTKSEEVLLLEEIRNLLKENTKYRSQIESVLGVSLIWNRGDDIKSCKVR